MANYYSGDRTENMPQASWPKPGINAVGEYQVSGQPFLLQYAPPIQGPDGEGAASDIFADDNLSNNDQLSFVNSIRGKIAENETTMAQIKNNSKEQALLGQYPESLTSLEVR